MERSELERLFRAVQSGELSPDAALERVSLEPIHAVGKGDAVFARLDTHRRLRRGEPEVVLCSGKSPSQLRSIAAGFLEVGHPLFATRANEGAFAALEEGYPGAHYYREARIVYAGRRVASRGTGVVEVLSAGTADLPVAEEAAITLELLGHTVGRIYDVGVAGLHRVLGQLDRLRRAAVLVVVAGMDGALPSVAAGLVACPVVAVPTSTGYGAAFGGVSALLAMLASCSPGVVTVNIDNGFGAGYAAARINMGATAAEPSGLADPDSGAG